MSDWMDIVAVHGDLVHLLEQVEAGDEITLVRAGRPIAKLVPYMQRRRPRRPGIWKGRVRIAPHFDAPIPEIDGAFG